MSGTSMDGLDVCLADIQRRDENLDVRVEAFSEYTYSAEWRGKLQTLSRGDTETVCRMNYEIAGTYVDFIKEFLDEHGLSVRDIDVIGSHGQTVWHEHRHSTLQLGEAAVLAENFGIPVVSNFRGRDIAAGGCGAPLVPFLDYILFKEMQKTLLVLNIGGIANFTILPGNADSVNNVYALDTGPGNSLMDLLAVIIGDGQRTCDRDGLIAKSGKIRRDILTHLMGHPYISSAMPKSTGREVFGKEMLNDIIREFSLCQKDYPDLMATLARYTAEAIYSNYQQFFANMHRIDEIIVSGGGAHNPVVMNHLRELFDGIPIRRIDEYGIPGDAKEALAFAVLAAAAIWRIPANVPNVTGARRSVVLGSIT
ncbi:MAG: anhydro-N-acetylmuramic acid kinase [Candidatus Marinimicrobia bacterium]|nr:anhydro-N-acetylmuramic acid kinase [Candidatus Neomarinimicrobiota bacterium]